jgi:hypothetical protein
MTTLLPKSQAGGLIVILGLVSGIATALTLYQKEERDRTRDDKQVFPAVKRLQKELDRITMTGTLCVTVGVAIAATGVGYAMLGALAADFPKDATPEQMYLIVATRVVPRISILIVIELFAYFFLKTYRQTFDQLRFYNAELTALELRLNAIETAKTRGSSGATTLEKILVCAIQTDHKMAEPIFDTPEATPELLEAAVKLINAAKNKD